MNDVHFVYVSADVQEERDTRVDLRVETILLLLRAPWPALLYASTKQLYRVEALNPSTRAVRAVKLSLYTSVLDTEPCEMMKRSTIRR